MDTLPEALLTGHLTALQGRAVAAATRERVAQALLDWFTAGWSARPMPQAETLRTLARAMAPGAGAAPMFGAAGQQTLAAAFANAGIAHLREIDDAHRAAMLHPGVVAITPVLALAAGGQLTQRRVVDAIVAGYEVALRIGEALGAGHAARFHATATAGAVGAAAAAGVALGLAPERLHHAMGIAATQATGLWQLVDDGAHEAKSLHPAFAVRNGLTAAWAAAAGLPGARAFVSGRRGLHALLAGDGPLEAMHTGFDAPERIHSATIKAWPCCAQLFTPLDATRALMEAHRFAAADIESVDVVIFPHALKIAGVDWPAKPAETCFSLRYVVATLLLEGRLGIEHTESPALDAAPLRALARRITVSTDEAFQREFPHKRPSRVSITLRDGRRVSALRELRRGDPEDPFDWPALQQRMRAFAPAMDDAAAHRITTWCEVFADAGRDGDACRPPDDLFA